MPAIRLPRRGSARAAAPAVAVAVVLAVLLAGCGYGSRAVHDFSGPEPAGGPKAGGLDRIRLGYFANVTHATPLVGLRTGGPITEELGGTRAAVQVFNAGPSAIEALNAKAVDMAWVGPSPTVNGYLRSGGRNLRIVAGATSGGASLVVDPAKVRSAADLKGSRIASPQLGNTQDVALLAYLKRHGIHVDPDTGKGGTSVLRQDNKEIPTTFRQGGIDGAWVPEPTASRLVAEGGKVLLDERKLWPGGRFVTTHLVARRDFLREHPAAVAAVLRGSVRTTAWIRHHPSRARKLINSALARDAGKPLPGKVLAAAFSRMEVTDDPLPATLRRQAADAVSTGLLDAAGLDGIYDLRLLDRIRAQHGRPALSTGTAGGGP